MDSGVVVLLDALGTERIYEIEPRSQIAKRWNDIDRLFGQFVKILSKKLKNSGYPSNIRIQRPYDNFQIFVPVGSASTNGAIDMSGTNHIWWTVTELGELLIPLFRKALANRIFLRGCVCQGQYFYTSKRTFGYRIDEAAKNYEVTEWLGIIAAYSSNLVLNVASQSTMSKIFNYFVEYGVRMKDGNTKKLFVLDWTKNIQNMYDNYQVDDEIILNVIKTEISNAKCDSVRNKWQNTLNFYNSFHTRRF